MPFDMSIPAGQEKCTAPWGRLKAAHDAIWQGLFQLDDALVLNIVSQAGVNLGAFKAGEYKFKYARIAWSLVTAVPANGGVGATESLPKNMSDYKKWSGANTRILPAGLIGYDAWGAPGLNFLALHETAHTTVLGMTMTDACWKDHQKNERGTDYGMDSEAWKKNERFANDIALVVARALKIEILGTANPGFDVKLGLAAAARPAPRAPAEIPLEYLDLNRTGGRAKPERPKTRKRGKGR